MAPSGTTTGGMLPSNRGRPSLWRTFVRLYQSEFAFQGVVDFFFIGAAVLLFLHPPTRDTMRPWMTLGGLFGSSDQTPQSASAPQAPAAGPSPPQQGTQPAAAPPRPQVATPSAPPTPPAPQTAAGTSAPTTAIPFPPEIAKPTLTTRMLVEIGENAFRSSSPADQQRLMAARASFRVGRHRELVDILKDADANDPNVAFMRGLGFLARNDEEGGKSAEAALRIAANGGHQLAKTVLGRTLILAPNGVTKNVEEGRRLIEQAVAAGDPQAQRIAAVAYINADFGVFDPGKAALLFKSAAEAGDPQAMFHYARVLSEGIGVQRNQAEAVKFIGRAAGAGLTNAQLTLGKWLFEQYRIKSLSDPTEAVSWLEQAYQKGFSLDALSTLAVLYSHVGRDPPWNDKTRYFELVRQCSGLAQGLCQFNYAVMHLNGWGAPKDQVRGFMHLIIARDLGYFVETKLLDDLASKLTTNERADAEDRARIIRQKLKPIPATIEFQYPEVVRPSPWAVVEEPARTPPPAPAPQPAPQQQAVAITGVPIAFDAYMAKPSGFYYWLIDLAPNAFEASAPQVRPALRAALAAYREQKPSALLDAVKNADANDPNVAFFKGLALLVLSNGRDADLGAQSYQNLRLAANAGQNQAAAVLGHVLLTKSPGFPQDVQQGRELLDRAARSGDRFATRQLAVEILTGAINQPDPVRAADLMWTSAELDDPVANATIATFFYNGTGVPRDADKAERYLRRAATLGLTDAQVVLGNWIIAKYREKVIPSPEEGVLELQRAMNTGRSLWANMLLVYLYADTGRERPWLDRQMAADYARRCVQYPHAPCHFALAAILKGGGGVQADYVRSWAHYDIARTLGQKDAVGRLDDLEKLMKPEDINSGRELSRNIQADLKPLPQLINLQGKR